MGLLAITVLFLAFFALCLVVWACCAAVAQRLDERIAKAGDFLLEAK